MLFMLHFKLLPLKSLKFCWIIFFDISFPVYFQVLNAPSKRQVMDHYIAANSVFVSQIL